MLFKFKTGVGETRLNKDKICFLNKYFMLQKYEIFFNVRMFECTINSLKVHGHIKIYIRFLNKVLFLQ